VIRSLDEFKSQCTIIITNRFHAELQYIINKVYICDLFNKDKRLKEIYKEYQDSDMDYMIEKLMNAKVVLFGADDKGKYALEYLIENSIYPLYFVDDNHEIKNIRIIDNEQIEFEFPVFKPEVLLNEDKSNLAVIIATDYSSYSEIVPMLNENGYCLDYRNLVLPSPRIECLSRHLMILQMYSLSLTTVNLLVPNFKNILMIQKGQFTLKNILIHWNQHNVI